jgi:hypothetical protein
MEKVVDAITDRAADLLRSVLYGIGDTPDGMCQQCGGYGLVSVPCDVGFADGMCPDCNGSGELNEATP